MIVEPLRKAGRAALLLLAAVLPFELTTPLARIGPLQLSSVEMFLYLALVLWGASLIARVVAGDLKLGRRARGRLTAAHRAVIALALVLGLSALAAAAPRAPGIKFALRSAGGMLLFAAAADLLQSSGARARTAAALVAGALVAALLAIAEAGSPRLGSLLRPFHPQTFQALGSPRGSGPLQYPNIAAMYLEASVPVAVALALTARRALAGWCVGTALLVFVLLDGVLATGSRAGLLGALAAVLVMASVGLRDRRSAPAAWAALAAATAAVGLLSGSTLGARLHFWHDGAWYAAKISPVPGAAGRSPARLAPAAEATQSLELWNRGALTWTHAGATPVTLSYHWLDAHGALAILDGLRTPLPTDVPAGGRITVRARVRAPTKPGRYLLWWDLAQERATWFSQRGSAGLREGVLVGDVGGAAPGLAPLWPSTFVAQRALPRRTLWRAALAAFRDRPLLGLGPDNFRHRYAGYLGLAPGTADQRLHANSLYFEILADLGLAGALAFGALIVVLVGTARRAAAPLEGRLLGWGVAIGLGTFLLHGLLDYFFEFTPTYALFWLLAGMLVAADRRPEEATGDRA